MISLTVENYLKGILLLQAAHPRQAASTGRIAAALGVAPGTVTAMLKTLEEARLVRYRRYGGVQLTREGKTLALHVLRRHRVVELFLVKVLGMPWTEVHEEAEALEHAVSEKVLERMDALLGHPTVDPHGDPIPPANGSLPVERRVPLSTASPGDSLVVVRLLDQRPEFLKLAERLGLQPSSRVEVLRRDEAGGVFHLVASSRRVAVGIAAAEKILVRPAQHPHPRHGALPPRYGALPPRYGALPPRPPRGGERGGGRAGGRGGKRGGRNSPP